MTDIRIFDSVAALSAAAAAEFVTAAQTAVSTNGRFLVALSGGSTPQTLFTLLAQPPYHPLIPWPQTHVFWGDERLVPPDQSGSNYRQAHDTLLAHVPIPPNQIHRVLGEMDSDTAVADYTAKLQTSASAGRPWPRFDLVLLGMGSDGHTASLFPGTISPAEHTNAVMAVTAEYDGRPARRITLTPRVINDARQILFLVAGKNKAEALSAVLHGPTDPITWPAQRIRPVNGRVTWLVDVDAASQLPPT